MSNTPRIDNIESSQNVIINGGMDFWQRGTSLTGVGNGSFLADRFQNATAFGSAIVFNQARSADTPTFQEAGFAFKYSVLNTVTTTDTIPANQIWRYNYKIEGNDYANIHGKQAVLSFWVKSSVTGTYGVSFQNSSRDRIYTTSYTIDSANTWERKQISLVMDDQGSWNFDESVGLLIEFVLDSGSQYFGSTVEDQWVSGSFGTHTAVSGQANLGAVSGATWRMTGLMMHEGETAGNFKRAGKTIGEELAYCQRYYERENSFDGNSAFWSGNVTNGDVYYTSLSYATAKRSPATVTILNTNEVGSFGATNPVSNSVNGFRIAKLATSTTNGTYFRITWSADAEL